MKRILLIFLFILLFSLKHSFADKGLFCWDKITMHTQITSQTEVESVKGKIESERLELKKELIDATLLSIEKSWQRISEDSCVFLDEEIIRHFELWRSKFKSMKPENYKFTYENSISFHEQEVPQIKGFGPIYPPISQKIKIDKSFKIGSELKLDNKHNYKVIKMSKNLENANFTEKEVTVYLVYVEYNPITLSNKCIYRVNPRMIDSRTYYVYVDEN
ncbi:MAG: hypothetical protein ABDH19_04605 [Thermodesulfovibrio sp.]